MTLPQGITVPNLPSGFAPFNIMNLGGSLYVAYAQQVTGSTDEMHGAGLGLIAKFDANGALQKVVTSGGNLNAPWGMAITCLDQFPGSSATIFSSGIFWRWVDQRVLIRQPGAFIGTLSDAGGKPIAINGLWGLSFGNGGNGGSANVLYFAAGPQNESQGALWGGWPLRAGAGITGDAGNRDAGSADTTESLRVKLSGGD